MFSLEERWLQRDPRAAPRAFGKVIEGTKLSSPQGCTEEKGQISGTEIKLKGGGAGGKIKEWEIHHLIFEGLQTADKALNSLIQIQS